MVQRAQLVPEPERGRLGHYTVRSSDGKVGQSVSDLNIAYHAGNWTYNQYSAGIEHEGYVSYPSWFTDALYRSSARLVAFLVDRYGILLDRQHIVDHNEVPGATHTDPGRYWDWDKYMGYVRQYSDSGGSSGYEQIVDNITSGRFAVSGRWSVSSQSGEKYSRNYHYTRPPRQRHGLLQVQDTLHRQVHRTGLVALDFGIQRRDAHRDKHDLRAKVNPRRPAPKRRPVGGCGHLRDDRRRPRERPRLALDQRQRLRGGGRDEGRIHVGSA